MFAVLESIMDPKLFLEESSLWKKGAVKRKAEESIDLAEALRPVVSSYWLTWALVVLQNQRLENDLFWLVLKYTQALSLMRANLPLHPEFWGNAYFFLFLVPLFVVILPRHLLYQRTFFFFFLNTLCSLRVGALLNSWFIAV